MFVTALGGWSDVATRDDLQKPPARMWLFGMVTLIELRYTRMIAESCPSESWRVPVRRPAEKGRGLIPERRRRHRLVELLDCLQLSDKGRIVARNEAIRGRTVLPSRRQAEDSIQLLEGLRNNLAHAQDIDAADWVPIVKSPFVWTQALDAEFQKEAV